MKSVKSYCYIRKIHERLLMNVGNVCVEKINHSYMIYIFPDMHELASLHIERGSGVKFLKQTDKKGQR